MKSFIRSKKSKFYFSHKNFSEEVSIRAKTNPICSMLLLEKLKQMAFSCDFELELFRTISKRQNILLFSEFKLNGKLFSSTQRKHIFFSQRFKAFDFNCVSKDVSEEKQT